MKKIKILLLILVICVFFSGCNGLHLSSIDDLISPVSPSEEEAEIQKALDDYCKTGYNLKIPTDGKYKTSFVFYDLNNNQNQEAIAFYEPQGKLGTINMAVMKRTAEKWSVVENIVGEGTDVNSLEFADADNDGNVDIIVCWKTITKSTNSNLCVYSQKNKDKELKLTTVPSTIVAADFVCVDYDNNKKNELLIFKYGSANQSPKATLYTLEGIKFKKLGETKLDNSIIAINSILVGETDEGVTVFVDALKSTGNSTVTEIIYWSDYYNTIISPYYNYNTGKTLETTRKNTIHCRDVDDDGKIEIPLDDDVKNLPGGITAQSWVCYDNNRLKQKLNSLHCDNDGYFLLLNKLINIKNINVLYEENNRTLKLINKSDKKEIFVISTVVNDDYDKSYYKGYDIIGVQSGYIYLAKINEEYKEKITTDELKKLIKVL